ncbi:hypothetical protein GCM10023214_74080 [Amycolatopsis dongchuanensis]|uniref:Uncharacterized protein n=1 Tax=Amycolatopsis dongchuanensis TaxID=1070866 RepID=A0ABP8VRG4_9PSEU
MRAGREVVSTDMHHSKNGRVGSARRPGDDVLEDRLRPAASVSRRWALPVIEDYI